MHFSASKTKRRTGWDSNPRAAFTTAGFQDRCIRPLCHPSGQHDCQIDAHFDARVAQGLLENTQLTAQVLRLAYRLATLPPEVLTALEHIFGSSERPENVD